MTGPSTTGAEPRPLAIVMPALNEATRIGASLACLGQRVAQCVVVDGGSQDDTVAVARACGAAVISAPRGRAAQMNAGAAHADPGADLLFLHADTLLPAAWAQAIERALLGGAHWGRFDVRMDTPGALLATVARAMNARSRLTGICTGDQAIFVTRAAWLRCNGYRALALMEDIDLSQRLKRLAGSPACLREQVTIAARRWQQRGPLRTIVLMWWIRWLYFAGVPPERLHALYYGRR